MEHPVHIASINMNLEIVAKLLNSVARKYDCRVQYHADENRLSFRGDTEHWQHITEELLEQFFPVSAMTLVPVRHRQNA